MVEYHFKVGSPFWLCLRPRPRGARVGWLMHVAVADRPTDSVDKKEQNRHREWLHRPERSALRARARRELRGLRLGCWCEQPGPCHGHNLCEVADADIDDDADGTA